MRLWRPRRGSTRGTQVTRTVTSSRGTLSVYVVSIFTYLLESQSRNRRPKGVRSTCPVANGTTKHHSPTAGLSFPFDRLLFACGGVGFK